MLRKVFFLILIMLKLNFHPFPELKTERLLLRRLTMDDAQEIFFLRSDKQVMEYIDREPATSVRQAEEYIQHINDNIDNNEAIMWAIALKDNPAKLVGTICFWQIKKEHYRTETGYVLHPAYWRKGIMKEALKKIVEYGFSTLRLHSIEAHITPLNVASAAILEAAGFIKEAHLKENICFRGEFIDTAIYSILNPEILVTR